MELTAAERYARRVREAKHEGTVEVLPKTESMVISVFVLEPHEEIWKPADIQLQGETATCESCGMVTRNWCCTYLQGGPPETQMDPDNIWIYECLVCLIHSSHGNIVDMDNAETYRMTTY